MKAKLNFYGKTHTLDVFRTAYSNNGSLAICLEEDKEPWSVLTVNLMDGVASEEYAYVDTNNNPWAEKFIKENKLGEPTGILGFSGYCQYPLYHFNVAKIEEIK